MHWLCSPWAGIAFLILPLLAGACASKIVPTREAILTVQPDDGVSVLFSSATPDTSASTGQQMVSCVTDAIEYEFPGVRLVPASDFLSAAFPGLAPEAAPPSRESLAGSLEDLSFRERAGSSGVRYLILVEGTTTQPEPWGGGECVGGYGGGGCFGLWVWRRESAFTASIFDVAEGISVGQVEATVTGRPWFTIFVIFPLGMPSFTESWACTKLGQGVAEFLRGTEKRTDKSASPDTSSTAPQWPCPGQEHCPQQ